MSQLSLEFKAEKAVEAFVSVNDRKRKHKLLTSATEKKMPALYEQDGKGSEAVVYAKFFSIKNYHG